MSDWKNDYIEAPQSWKDEYVDVSSEGPSINEPVNAYSRGVVQGATAGFRDEAAGALKNWKGGAKKAASYLGYDTSGDSDVAEYEKERDESRRLDDVAMKQDPTSYLAGELTPTVAMSLIPVAGQLAGLSRAAKAAQLTSGAIKGSNLASKVKSGMAVGGLYGAGASKSDNLKDLALDTTKSSAMGGGFAAIPSKAAIGSALGLYMSKDDLAEGNYGNAAAKTAASIAGTYAASKALGKLPGIEKIQRKVKSKADDFAYNATEADPKVVEQWRKEAMLHPSEPTQGDFLRKNNIVGWFNSGDKIGRKASKLNKEAGEQIGGLIDEVKTRGTPIDKRSIQLDFLSKAKDFYRTKLNPNQATALVKDARKGLKKKFDIEQLEQMARDQKNLAFDAKSGLVKDSHAAELAHARQNALEKGVERTFEATDQDLLNAYKAQKDLFGRTDHISKNWSKKSAARNQKPLLSNEDINTAGFTGIATGDPAATIAAPIARRFLGPRAASTIAKSGWLASDALKGMSHINGSKLSDAALSGLTRQNIKDELEKRNYEKLLELLSK